MPASVDEGLMTPEFVDRQYNMRAAVPDHATWFARWAEWSARARQSLDCRPDLRYGKGTKETLDLFPAANPRGTFVFLHGGYWRALDKADFSFVAPPLVERGVSVAVVNYDLCPAVTIGEIGEQCRRAIEWLLRRGADHGVPPKSMVVGGHSAGGHLAALMFATDWRGRGIDLPPLTGGVAISGVFDLAPMVHFSYTADPRLNMEAAREWSPSRMAARIDAPFLLCVGDQESAEFARQSTLLWDRWPGCRPRGATGPLFIRDRHHFSVVSDLAAPDSALSREVLALF